MSDSVVLNRMLRNAQDEAAKPTQQSGRLGNLKVLAQDDDQQLNWSLAKPCESGHRSRLNQSILRSTTSGLSESRHWALLASARPPPVQILSHDPAFSLVDQADVRSQSRVASEGIVQLQGLPEENLDGLAVPVF